MNRSAMKKSLAPLLLTPFATAVSAGEIFDDVKISDDSSTIQLSNLDRFGSAAAGIGDLDGDGFADIVVGAQADDTTNTDNGAVHICFLDANAEVQGSSLIAGGSAGESDIEFGRCVANLGDIDGDGVTDIAVGEEAAVTIFFLNDDGSHHGSQRIADGVGGFSGGSGNSFGVSVSALPDLDGNGVADLLVGDSGDTDNGGNSGAVYVLHLQSDGTVLDSRKVTEGSGGFAGDIGTGDLFGASVAYLGNLDGDSHDEIAVGSYGDDDGGTSTGAVWVLDIDDTGFATSTTKLGALNGIGALQPYDRFGTSVAAIGDVNQDGIPDLAVGAVGDDGDTGANWDYGAIHIVLLKESGDPGGGVEFSIETSPLSSELSGFDSFGAALGTVGDLNGDGIDELIVGAEGDDDGGNGRGAAYILYHKGLVQAEVDDYGCDLNGDDTLFPVGDPVLGDSMTFWVDNPFGTQSAGSVSFLAVSLTGLGSPCGVMIPGYSMLPGGPLAELLVLDPFAVLIGPVWLGTLPVDIDLPIPNSTAFLGLEVFVQGGLYDPFAGPSGVEIGLTTGAKVTLGSCD